MENGNLRQRNKAWIRFGNWSPKLWFKDCKCHFLSWSALPRYDFFFLLEKITFVKGCWRKAPLNCQLNTHSWAKRTFTRWHTSDRRLTRLLSHARTHTHPCHATGNCITFSAVIDALESDQWCFDGRWPCGCLLKTRMMKRMSQILSLCLSPETG